MLVMFISLKSRWSLLIVSKIIGFFILKNQKGAGSYDD